MKEGVSILDEIETFKYGKFVQILDPEGNKVELWKPNDIEFKLLMDEPNKPFIQR